MSKIYELEDQVREMSSDPIKYQSEIYDTLKEIIARLLARNPSRYGEDVDLPVLIHDLASYICTRIAIGTLKNVEHWSGYIMTILPRFTQNNAKIYGQEIVSTTESGINLQNIIDMNHAGSLSFINDFQVSQAVLDAERLSLVIEDWMDKHIRYLEKNSRIYCNLRISIMLSLLKNKVILFRLPKDYYNTLVVYLNRIKVKIIDELIQDLPENPYDQVERISRIETLEEDEL